MDRFDVDALDDDWPFEADHQIAHLFKHPKLGLGDIGDVWASDPLFYPAAPPAHWLMVAEVEGRVLTADEARLAFVSLVSGHMLGNRIALPVNVSSVADKLAAVNDVTIKRTKTSTVALMAAATESGVGFAASGDGGFILPGFLPAFDAGAALVKMLELLARADTTLSTVRESLPRSYQAHETVVTPWEQKGLVMRTLVELSKDRRLELIDGVKVIHDDGWVLALPDPEEPVTHIWAEGSTQAAADSLAREYVRRIRQTLR